MTEGQPRSGPDQQRAETGGWDVGRVAAALDALPEARTDVAFGSGVEFRLGSDQPTQLEIYPATGVVRVTSEAEGVQLTLFRQSHPPTIAAEGLIFEIPSQPARRWLSVNPTGAATLCFEPAEPSSGPRMPAATTETPERPTTPLTPGTPATDDPEAPDEAFQPPLPEPRQTGQPRVVFAGRLGKDPMCRTTPREILVCTFPLAEKREGFEKPTWRTVVTFKDVARKVQQTLKKGMFAEVVAYEHQKARRTKDGGVRLETQYYATVVKPR